VEEEEIKSAELGMKVEPAPIYIFIDGARTGDCFCVVTEDEEASVPFFHIRA
jgi:hypothetical protein